MDRYTIVLTVLVTLSIVVRSSGQDSTIWLDTRDNVTSAGTGIGGQLIGSPASPYTNGQNPVAGGGNSTDRFGTVAMNAGGRGAGAVLRLNPAQLNGFHATANPNGGTGWPNYDVDTNSATGNLWYYIEVNNNAACPGGNLNSIGITTTITQGPNNGPMRNTIGSATMTVFSPPQVPAAWTANSPPVTVPGPLPTFGCTTMNGPTGLPIGGPYRFAQLRVTAALRDCNGFVANTHVDNSTYSVKLSVCAPPGISRVCASSFDNVSIGYDPYVANGTFGTLDASINGGAGGATSASPDAVIQIRLRGDFNGNGTVSGVDIAGFNAALSASQSGTLRVSQAYLGDFNNNRTVTGADIAGFVNAIGASGSVPCP